MRYEKETLCVIEETLCVIEETQSVSAENVRNP